jgi:hypothetical protein
VIRSAHSTYRVTALAQDMLAYRTESSGGGSEMPFAAVADELEWLLGQAAIERPPTSADDDHAAEDFEEVPDEHSEEMGHAFEDDDSLFND